jgi:hypothetical protein
VVAGGAGAGKASGADAQAQGGRTGSAPGGSAARASNRRASGGNAGERRGSGGVGPAASDKYPLPPALGVSECEQREQPLADRLPGFLQLLYVRLDAAAAQSGGAAGAAGSGGSDRAAIEVQYERVLQQKVNEVAQIKSRRVSVDAARSMFESLMNPC